MSFLKRHSCRRGSAAMLILIAVALLPAATACAAGAVRTNSLPYANNFEASPGSSIISTAPLGWSAADTNYAVVVTTNYSPSAGYPLSGAHTAVAKLSTDGNTITNILSGSNNTNAQYWIDMNIRMVSNDSEPSSITNDSGIQTAMYLSSSSNLVLYHAMPDNPAIFDTASTNYFTTLSHTAIENDSWHRLTLELDYFTADDIYALDHEFVRVLLDGTAISNATWAWDINNLGAGPGGEWFLCANSDSSSNRLLSAALLSGTGHFDDFVVTNGAPSYTVSTFTNGVPGWWLANYTLTQDDTASGAMYDDGDAHPAWAEWLLGTHPKVSNDFTLVVESNGGTNFLKWVTDANLDTGADGTILLRKSTNLLEGYTSTNDSNARSTLVAGTNTWEDTGGDAMYRLGVTTD